MILIPTSATDVLYSQVTTLDGTDYTLTFQMNLREGRWYLDLADQDGVMISPNIPLVVNWDLLRRVLDPRRPPGRLVCIDSTGAGRDPGPDTAPELYYVEEATLAEDPRLYGRRATVTIDTLQVDCGGPGQFDVSFEVEKRADGKPNTADIRIWNLNPAHRGELTAKGAAVKKKKVLVQIEAGYVAGTSRIFRGDLRQTFHEHVGPDIITHVEAGDGEWTIPRAKISKSWAPGTSVATVLRDIASSLGLGHGNIATITAPKFLGGGEAFVGGTVASGKAVRELTRITRSLGLEWSIQDGTLQFLATGKSLEGTAILLNRETGMVGSPNLDHKGRLQVKALILPDVFPGRKIKLDAAELQGSFKISQCKFAGNTAELDWYVDIEAVRL